MITQSRGSEVLLKGSLVGVPTYCLNENTLSSARHFFIGIDLIAYNNNNNSYNRQRTVPMK